MKVNNTSALTLLPMYAWSTVERAKRSRDQDGIHDMSKATKTEYVSVENVWAFS